MSELNLASSAARAAERFGTSSRRRRSDAGRSRLDPRVEQILRQRLAVTERPSMSAVHAAVAAECRRHGLRPPSRATVYNAMARVEAPLYPLAELPSSVRQCLHNVGGAMIPGHQIVFAAFNYGDARALTYAAGLPWSCLYRAERLRGFRPKSLALLRAVMAFRKI